MLVVLFLCAVAGLFLWSYCRFLKKLRCGNMSCVTGGIKTGKSTLSIWLAYHLWKTQVFKVWLINHVCFWIKHKREKPLLYSNIPLNLDYVQVTRDLLLRKKRFVYGSVVYLCEASIIADSMTYRDPLVNEALLFFNKLFAHETKGGYLIYDTQSIADNHFAVKRCLSSYFYIHHTIKIPFFLVMFIREERYSDDNSVVSAYTEDVDNSLKVRLVPKRIWKLFDCYCYSSLTDSLPVYAEVQKGKRKKSLKSVSMPSFKKFYTINAEDFTKHE